MDSYLKKDFRNTWAQGIEKNRKELKNTDQQIKLILRM